MVQGQRDEPTMSDATILMTVEDLINRAMGPPKKNTIDFKMIQAVLVILARQLRVLEQQVEIRVQDVIEAESGQPRSRFGDTERKTSPDKRSKGGKSRGRSKDRVKSSQEEGSSSESKGTKVDKKGGKDDIAGREDTGKSGKSDTREDMKVDKNKRDTSKDKYLAGKEKGRDDVEKSKSKKGEDVAHNKSDKVSPRHDDDKKGKSDRDKSHDRQNEGKDLRGKKHKDEDTFEARRTATLSTVSAPVEKAPGASGVRVGSIEVVTQSQFALLQDAVRQLQQTAAPSPAQPTLPDNSVLRAQLADGSASLPATMQAMQVTARVQATEQAVQRLAELLTQLATSGALPRDLAEKVTETKLDLDAKGQDAGGKSRTAKSVAIDPMAEVAHSTRSDTGRLSAVASAGSRSQRFSVASIQRPSVAATPRTSMAAMPMVTRKDMEDALDALRDDLMHNMNQSTAKATASSEAALQSAKSVTEKLEIALKLSGRISSLQALVSDYVEQLSGFDAGLSTQMQGFQEQMSQMRNDLQGGLKLLEATNSNTETAAVRELNSLHDLLVLQLEDTTQAHAALHLTQHHLTLELRSLMETVEMLREQKADREEVLDCLRDKADNSKLEGLLTEVEFALAKEQLERRLAVCYDKFTKQDNVWQGALKELSGVTETKAELIQLLAMREATQSELRALRACLEELARVVGEPEAAMLTRELARGAVCGACLSPALMAVRDKDQGAPPRLPALRPVPEPAPALTEPCLAVPAPEDHRQHVVHRWTGGSHTVMSDVARVLAVSAARPTTHTGDTRRYSDYGTDGKLYKLEEPLQPCAECNAGTDMAAQGDGASVLGKDP